MLTKPRTLPTYDAASEGEDGGVASFDLHGHVDAETVEVFLADLTANPDEYENYGHRDEDTDLPSWWGGFEVEHMWRTTACDPDMHEPDEECVCDWKEWHYTSIGESASFAILSGEMLPGEHLSTAPSGAVAVTRLTPARMAESPWGHRCYAHPHEPATTGLPEHCWPEQVVLAPERYTVVTESKTITEVWAINREQVGTVVLDRDSVAWQYEEYETTDGDPRFGVRVRTRWSGRGGHLNGHELIERGPLRVVSRPKETRYLYACRDCATALHETEREQTRLRVAEINRLDAIGVGHLFWRAP